MLQIKQTKEDLFPICKDDRYDHQTRVLAFLAEQKIADLSQIILYCFPGRSPSLVRKILNRLLDFKLIEKRKMYSVKKYPFFSYNLSKLGLKELKVSTENSLDKYQIKSNYPDHDLILTSLRLLFLKLEECKAFLSENIIRSKILEEDLGSIAVFRSCRSDACVLVKVPSGLTWLSVEYERRTKATSRYVKQIKNWYENTSLPGVLFIADDRSLIEQLSKIDSTILPHLQRKILYLCRGDIDKATTQIKFHNCNQQALTFNLSCTTKIFYPILEQQLPFT